MGPGVCYWTGLAAAPPSLSCLLSCVQTVRGSQGRTEEDRKVGRCRRACWQAGKEWDLQEGSSLVWEPHSLSTAASPLCIWHPSAFLKSPPNSSQICFSNVSFCCVIYTSVKMIAWLGFRLIIDAIIVAEGRLYLTHSVCFWVIMLQVRKTQQRSGESLVCEPGLPLFCPVTWDSSRYSAWEVYIICVKQISKHSSPLPQLMPNSSGA